MGLYPLFLAVLVASASAGPLSFNNNNDEKCSIETCPSTSKMGFVPGQIYKYDYKTLMETKMLDREEDKSSLIMKAVVEIDVLSNCEFNMRLEDVSLNDVHPRTHKESAAANQKLFTRQMQENGIRFAMINGKVVGVCPSDNDDEKVINAKKAIITAFQYNREHQDMDDGIETDVLGTCPVKYERINSWTSVNVDKKKDITKCSQRYHTNLGMQFMPIDSNGQNVPFMQSDSTCSQTYKNYNDYLKSSRCVENHVHKPFQVYGKGIHTRIEQVLNFIRQQPIGAVQRYNPITRRTDLLFNHQVLNDQSTSTKDAEETLVKLSKSMENGVEKQTPILFADLISQIELLDANTLVNFYNQMKNDKQAQKFIRDTIPHLRNAASIKMLKELISNGDLVDSQADIWITSIAFISNPTRQTMNELLQLLETVPYGKSLALSASSLVSTFCRKENCESDITITKIRDFFVKHLDSCKSRDMKHHQRIITTLKALGNMGCSDSVTIDTLLKCAEDKTVDMETRVEAVKAFRRFPCMEERRLREILFNGELDSELRINAYISLMRCPTKALLLKVNRMLEIEKINQVGSFVWTHLTNLAETNDEFKWEIRRILSDMTIAREFNLDKRMYSRNVEMSYYNRQLKAGGKVDSNIIFSQKTFLPRSMNLNLSVEMFGASINLLEIGGRMQGVEKVLEKFFAKDDDVVKNDNAILENFDRKYNAKSDDLQASMYARVFGNEIAYVDQHDNFNGMEIDLLTWMQDLASGSTIDFTKSMQFINHKVTIPTHFGFPMTLKVAATSTVNMKANGKLDMSEMMAGKVNINGQLRPSGSIVVESEISSDLFVAKSGLKTITTLHTSTNAQGKLIINKNEIDFELNVPEKKMDIFSFDRKFFMLYRENYEVIETPEKMQSSTPTCMSIKSLGMDFCTHVSYRSFASFGGPIDIGFGLEKTDTFTVIKLHGRNIPEERRVSLLIDTPNSKIDRKIQFDMQFGKQGNSFDIQASAPYKNTRIELKCEANYPSLKQQNVNVYANYENKIWRVKFDHEHRDGKSNADLVISRPQMEDIKLDVNFAYKNKFDNVVLEVKHFNLLREHGKFIATYKQMEDRKFKVELRNHYGEVARMLTMKGKMINYADLSGSIDITYTLNNEIIRTINLETIDTSNDNGKNVKAILIYKCPSVQFKTISQLNMGNKKNFIEMKTTYNDQTTSFYIQSENFASSKMNINQQLKINVVHTPLAISNTLLMSMKRQNNPDQIYLQLTGFSENNKIVNILGNHQRLGNTLLSQMEFEMHSVKYFKVDNKLLIDSKKYSDDLTISLLERNVVMDLDYDMTSEDLHTFRIIFKNPYTQPLEIKGETGTDLSDYHCKVSTVFWGLETGYAMAWKLQSDSTSYRFVTDMSVRNTYYSSSLKMILNNKDMQYDNDFEMTVNDWFKTGMQLNMNVDKSKPSLEIMPYFNSHNAKMQLSGSFNDNFIVNVHLTSTFTQPIHLKSESNYDQMSMNTLTIFKYAGEKQLQFQAKYKMQKYYKNLDTFVQLETPYGLLKLVKASLNYNLKKEGDYTFELMEQYNENKMTLSSSGKLASLQEYNCKLQFDTTFTQPWKLTSMRSVTNGKCNTESTIEKNNNQLLKITTLRNLNSMNPSFNVKVTKMMKDTLELSGDMNLIKDSNSVLNKLNGKGEMKIDWNSLRKQYVVRTTMENSIGYKYLLLKSNLDENEYELKLEANTNSGIAGTIDLVFPSKQNSPINANLKYAKSMEGVHLDCAFKHPQLQHKFNGDFNGNMKDMKLVMKYDRINALKTSSETLRFTHACNQLKDMSTSLNVQFNGESYDVKHLFTLTANQLDMDLNVVIPQGKYDLNMENSVSKSSLKFDNKLNWNNQIGSIYAQLKYPDMTTMNGELKIKTPFEQLRKFYYEIDHKSINNVWEHDCKTIYNDYVIPMNIKLDLNKNKIHFDLDCNKIPELKVTFDTTLKLKKTSGIIEGSFDNTVAGKYDVEGELKVDDYQNWDVNVKLTSNNFDKIQFQNTHKGRNLPMGTSSMNSMFSYGNRKYTYDHDFEMNKVNELKKAIMTLGTPNGDIKLDANYNLKHHNYPGMCKYESKLVFNSPWYNMQLDGTHDFDEKTSKMILNAKHDQYGEYKYNHDIDMPNMYNLKNFNVQLVNGNGQSMDINMSYKLGKSMSNALIKLTQGGQTLYGLDVNYNGESMLKHDGKVSATYNKETFTTEGKININEDYKSGDVSFTVSSSIPDISYEMNVQYAKKGYEYTFSTKLTQLSNVLFLIDYDGYSNINYARYNSWQNIEYRHTLIINYAQALKYKSNLDYKLKNAYELERFESTELLNGQDYKLSMKYKLTEKAISGNMKMSGSSYDPITFEIEGESQSYTKGKMECIFGMNGNTYTSGYEYDVDVYNSRVNDIYYYYMINNDHNNNKYSLRLSGGYNDGKAVLKTPLKGYQECGLSYTQKLIEGAITATLSMYKNTQRITYSHEMKLDMNKQQSYANIALSWPDYKCKLNVAHSGNLKDFENGLEFQINNDLYSIANRFQTQFPFAPKLTVRTEIKTPFRNYESYKLDYQQNGWISGKFDNKLVVDYYGKTYEISSDWDVSKVPMTFVLKAMNREINGLLQIRPFFKSELNFIDDKMTKYGVAMNHRGDYFVTFDNDITFTYADKQYDIETNLDVSKSPYKFTMKSANYKVDIYLESEPEKYNGYLSVETPTKYGIKFNHNGIAKKFANTFDLTWNGNDYRIVSEIDLSKTPYSISVKYDDKSLDWNLDLSNNNEKMSTKLTLNLPEKYEGEFTHEGGYKKFVNYGMLRLNGNDYNFESDVDTTKQPYFIRMKSGLYSVDTHMNMENDRKISGHFYVNLPTKYGLKLNHEGSYRNFENDAKMTWCGTDNFMSSKFNTNNNNDNNVEIKFNDQIDLKMKHTGNINNFVNNIDLLYNKYEIDMTTTVKLDDIKDMKIIIQSEYTHPTFYGSQRQNSIFQLTSNTNGETTMINFQTRNPFTTEYMGNIVAVYNSKYDFNVEAKTNKPVQYSLKANYKSDYTYKNIQASASLTNPRKITYGYDYKYALKRNNNFDLELIVNHPEKSGFDMKYMYDVSPQSYKYECISNVFIQNRALPMSASLEKNNDDFTFAFSGPLANGKTTLRLKNTGIETEIDATALDKALKCTLNLQYKPDINIEFDMKTPTHISVKLTQSGQFDDLKWTAEGQLPIDALPNIKLSGGFKRHSKGHQLHFNGNWLNAQHDFDLMHNYDGKLRQIIGNCNWNGIKHATNFELRNNNNKWHDFKAVWDHKKNDRKFINTNLYLQKSKIGGGGLFSSSSTLDMKSGFELTCDCPYVKDVKVFFDTRKNGDSIKTNLKGNYNDYVLDMSVENEGQKLDVIIKKPINMHLEGKFTTRPLNVALNYDYEGKRSTADLIIDTENVNVKRIVFKMDGYQIPNINFNSKYETNNDDMTHETNFYYKYNDYEQKYKHAVDLNRKDKNSLVISVNAGDFNPKFVMEKVSNDNKFEGLITLQLTPNDMVKMTGLVDQSNIKWRLTHPQSNVDISLMGEIKEMGADHQYDTVFKYMMYDGSTKKYTSTLYYSDNKGKISIACNGPSLRMQFDLKNKISQPVRQEFSFDGIINDNKIGLNAMVDFKKLVTEFDAYLLDNTFKTYAKYVDGKDIKLALVHNGNEDGHLIVLLDSPNLALFDAKWKPSAKHELNNKFQSVNANFQQAFSSFMDVVSQEIENRLQPITKFVRENRFYSKTILDYSINKPMEYCMEIVDRIYGVIETVQNYCYEVYENVTNYVTYKYEQLVYCVKTIYYEIYSWVENTHNTLSTHEWTKDYYNTMYNTDIHKRMYKNALYYGNKYHRYVYNSPVWSRVANYIYNKIPQITIPERFSPRFAELCRKAIINVYMLVKDQLHDLIKPEMTRINEYNPDAGTVVFQAYSPFEMSDLHTLPKMLPTLKTWGMKLYSKVKDSLPSMEKKMPDFGVIYDIYYNLKPKSYNPIDYIPPFTKQATLSGNTIRTFDKKFYDFSGKCTYVLARDFLSNKFAVLVDYSKSKRNLVKKIITIVTGPKTIEIEGDKVKLQKRPIELPLYEDGTLISRQASSILVNNTQRGIEIQCQLQYDRCTVRVTGWYFGKTGGLMGTYNNEPESDLMKSDRSMANNGQDMADSWMTESNGCTKYPAVVGEISTKNTQVCDQMFKSYTSPLRKCFGQVPASDFNEMCIRSKSQKEMCKVAEFYKAECQEEGVDVDMPSTCAECWVGDKHIAFGDEKEVRGGNKVDIIFVIEKCMDNLKVYDKLKTLTRRITDTYKNDNDNNDEDKSNKANKAVDIKFGMVGFGGQSQYANAHLHTSNGELLVDSEKSGKFFNKIKSQSRKDTTTLNSSIADALHLAAKFPYRDASTKSIILIPCGQCKSNSMPNGDLYRLSTLLRKHQIHAHVMMDENLLAKKGKFKSAHLWGVDANRIYTNRLNEAETRNHIEQRKYVYKPLDECSSLAEYNSGSIFSQILFKNLNQRYEKTYMDSFGLAIKNVSGVKECQKCRCGDDDDSSSNVFCRDCNDDRTKYGMKNMEWGEI